MNMRRMRWFWPSHGEALLLTLVCLFVTGQAAVAQEPPTSSERVQFASGATAATRKGSIRGYDTRDYILRASEGQTMTVKLASKNGYLYFTVLDKNTMEALEGDPPAREVTAWTGRLPQTGDYAIRVYLVRAEARRGGVASYTLSMDITGRAGSKGAQRSAESTAVQYFCEPNVDLLATFMQTDPPSVRIRFGTQDETLRLVPAGSGSKYVKGRMSFWSKGDEAMLVSPVLNANCKQR